MAGSKYMNEYIHVSVPIIKVHNFAPIINVTEIVFNIKIRLLNFSWDMLTGDPNRPIATTRRSGGFVVIDLTHGRPFASSQREFTSPTYARTWICYDMVFVALALCTMTAIYASRTKKKTTPNYINLTGSVTFLPIRYLHMLFRHQIYVCSFYWVLLVSSV
jgi:hypothetical protein